MNSQCTITPEEIQFLINYHLSRFRYTTAASISQAAIARQYDNEQQTPPSSCAIEASMFKQEAASHGERLDYWINIQNRKGVNYE